jgi:hypothetical protein
VPTESDDPASALPSHPVRVALLDLLAELETVTSTVAAQRLGYSSGLCSFHLRQLARHGLIEEAPHTGGRVRPWRLRWESPEQSKDPSGFGGLARGLEDESYRQWSSHRGEAPEEWRRDDAFSTVLHLTPDELGELVQAMRRVIAGYAKGSGRRPGTRPVAAVVRLFPLLTPIEEAEERK